MAWNTKRTMQRIEGRIASAIHEAHESKLAELRRFWARKVAEDNAADEDRDRG